jgi:hypothetical protein
MSNSRLLSPPVTGLMPVQRRLVELGLKVKVLK